MRKTAFLFVILTLTATALFAQTLPRLAVAEFTTNNQSDSLKEVAIAARNMVHSHMASMRQYTMVTSDEIDLLLDNQKIQVSSISSTENIQKLQRTNINYIVTGSVNVLFGEYTIIVSLLDVSSGEFPYSAREDAVGASSREFANGINSMMDKFTGGMVAVGDRVRQSGQGQTQRSYKIGDTGPGGGIIFAVEGNSYMEVSRLLGDYTWDDAVRVARDFRGGGFSDWHLPSRGELNLVYQNLQKSGVVNLGTGWYWSSSQFSSNNAWDQYFSDGRQGTYDKNDTGTVRAVRAF
jgi:hypothetical protein